MTWGGAGGHGKGSVQTGGIEVNRISVEPVADVRNNHSLVVASSKISFEVSSSTTDSAYEILHWTGVGGGVTAIILPSPTVMTLSR